MKIRFIHNDSLSIFLKDTRDNFKGLINVAPNHL